MRPQLVCVLAVEGRAAHLIERRNEDGLLGSAAGEAETGSRWYQDA